MGDKAFADLFISKVPDSWRVVNEWDFVTSIPRILGWFHIRNRVRIDILGNISIQDVTPNPHWPPALPRGGLLDFATRVSKEVDSCACTCSCATASTGGYSGMPDVACMFLNVVVTNKLHCHSCAEDAGPYSGPHRERLLQVPDGGAHAFPAWSAAARIGVVTSSCLPFR